MAQKKDETPTLLDLDLVLSEWQSRPELAAALKKALENDTDLAVATDEDLSQIDTAQKSRLLYAVSLKRLLNFLRTVDGKYEDRKTKAQLAFAYIKHAESGGLSAQLLGRGVTDEKFIEEIQKARAQLQLLADQKAKILSDESVN